MKQSFVHSIRAIGALAIFALMAGCTDSGSPTGADTNLHGQTTNTTTAASIQAATGNAQSATVGTAVAVAPTVVVKNASGAALAGVTVNFTVTGGNGIVQNPVALTDAQGVASAGTWTLGSSAGTNSLSATIGSLPAVQFVATGTVAVVNNGGDYNITIKYLAGVTAAQETAVSNAVARWQSVITKDLVNIPLNAPAAACFTTQPAINQTIDDIVIYVEFVAIDGPGQILGEAGPCYIRSDNSLPVMGHLKLDIADLQLMEKSGTLNDVVLHEMGHILGIGTLWPDKALLQGSGTPDPRFIGANAIAAYRAMGGLDANVAVENTGADGTKDGHWRETVFGNELMTGYISGPGNPMSAMTIASLADLGYGTNAGAASAFTLSRTSGGVVAQQGTELDGHEHIARPKWKVDHHGNKTKLEN